MVNLYISINLIFKLYYLDFDLLHICGNLHSRLSHELKFKENGPILAKDANKKDDDWYEVYDPRNPINKRRRGEESKKFNN